MLSLPRSNWSLLVTNAYSVTFKLVLVGNKCLLCYVQTCPCWFLTGEASSPRNRLCHQRCWGRRWHLCRPPICLRWTPPPCTFWLKRHGSSRGYWGCCKFSDQPYFFLHFVHFVVPMGIFPMVKFRSLSPRKASCNVQQSRATQP